MYLYVMDGERAASYTEATKDRDARLEPREIAAGPYAGKFVLPLDVIDAPEFADLDFSDLEKVNLNRAKAWPPERSEP